MIKPLNLKLDRRIGGRGFDLKGRHTMPPQDAPKLEGSAKHRENNDGTQGKYIKYLINSWSELLKEHHYIMMKIIQEASLSFSEM